MFRTLAAAAIGVTLAVAPIATAPAQALDERQTAGIVAGAVILGLGAALSQNGNVGVRVHAGPSNRGYGRFPRGSVRALPAGCLHNFNTRRGTNSVFGRQCLARSGVNLRQLPRRCETDIFVNGRLARVYEARCLQHNGWRVARRHY